MGRNAFQLYRLDHSLPQREAIAQAQKLDSDFSVYIPGTTLYKTTPDPDVDALKRKLVKTLTDWDATFEVFQPDFAILASKHHITEVARGLASLPDVAAEF